MSNRNSCLKRDEIRFAKFADEAPGFSQKRRRPRGRRALGIKYERRVHRHFMALYGDRYIPSPWIIYSLKGCGGLKWAQPDGLLIDVERGIITICEMKYQHCQEAYWQLVGKYLPLLERIFPKRLWRFTTVEVVKWYDCGVKFPATVTLRKRIELTRVGEFGVHIWKP
jgi:hypothetical protein